jgi:hypothetical protein
MRLQSQDFNLCGREIHLSAILTNTLQIWLLRFRSELFPRAIANHLEVPLFMLPSPAQLPLAAFYTARKVVRSLQKEDTPSSISS